MHVKDQIRTIEAAYNPDRELGGPDCPRVRYPEYVLLQVVKEQQERIEQLERQVAQLIKIAEDTTDTCGNLSGITEIQRARIEQLERRLQALINQQNHYNFEGV